MGRTCYWTDGTVFGISSNHFEFERIYSISKAYGKTGKIIANDVCNALQHPDIVDVIPWDDKPYPEYTNRDGIKIEAKNRWTTTLDVFKRILIVLLVQALERPDQRLDDFENEWEYE